MVECLAYNLEASGSNPLSPKGILGSFLSINLKSVQSIT
jgi:hypothetical protein